MRACSTPTATRPLIAATNPACVALRPGVRLRDQPHRAGRPAPDVRLDRRAPARRERLLLHHRLQRAVRDAARARATSTPKASCAASTCSAAPRPATATTAPRIQLLASGVSVPWALKAQQMLAEEWQVRADVWSVTSWNELARDALAADSWNLLHPTEEPRTPYITVEARRHRTARRSRSATTCVPCPTRSRSGCPTTGTRSAPTASASPTPGPPRVASSRSTPSRSWSARSRRSAKRGEFDPAKRRRGRREVPDRRPHRRPQRQARRRRRLGSATRGPRSPRPDAAAACLARAAWSRPRPGRRSPGRSRRPWPAPRSAPTTRSGRSRRASP